MIAGGTGNNEIHGGSGTGHLDGCGKNNWIDGGTGNYTISGGLNSWITCGTGNVQVYAGGGNSVIYGGPGTDTIYAQTGDNEIYTGTGTNTVTGGNTFQSASSSLIDDRLGTNTIMTWMNASNPVGGVCVQETRYYYEGKFFSLTSEDGPTMEPGWPVSAPYVPACPAWWFNGVNSSRYLGEGTVTPVAVYASWSPNDSLVTGQYWTNDAQYLVYDGSNLLATVDVNQQDTCPSDSPNPNDHPWKLLGVFNTTSGTVNVQLRDGNSNPSSAEMLNFGDVMLRPIRPIVSIRADEDGTGQFGTYDDYLNAISPAEIPLEDGQMPRLAVQLNAAVDAVYAQMPGASMSDWKAILPAVPGLEFWDAPTGGSQLGPVDGNGDLINDAVPANGEYSKTVWVSADPGSATVASTNQIAFEVDPQGITVKKAIQVARAVGTFSATLTSFFTNGGQNDRWESANTITWTPPPGFPSSSVRLFQIVDTKMGRNGPWPYNSSDTGWHDDTQHLIAKGCLTDWNVALATVAADPGIVGQSAAGAQIYDTPGQEGGPFVFQYSLKQDFKVAAVCIDKNSSDYGKVYGVLEYGEDIYAVKGAGAQGAMYMKRYYVQGSPVKSSSGGYTGKAAKNVPSNDNNPLDDQLQWKCPGNLVASSIMLGVINEWLRNN